MKRTHTYALMSAAGALMLAYSTTGPANAAAGAVTNAQICATAQERFFDEDFGIECGRRFHHYNTGAVAKYYKPKKNHQILIGGFNTFHLGDNQSRFKDYSVMAEIMNQWDVVAANEVSPLPKLEASLNEALAGYIAKLPEGTTKVTTEDGAEIKYEDLYAQYIPTGYIRLLRELIELDPSWSLLLQSEGVGDSTHTELVGLFYRASTVKPVPTAICEGDLGCTSTYPESKRIAVEREPFLGSFKAGNFDFTVMGLHLRFREPKGDGVMAKLQSIFDGSAFGIKKAEDIARLAELKTITDFVGKAAADEEKDLIVVGDFNLERTGRFDNAWKEAIKGFPGAIAYLNTPTSISKMNGLASNYDHFILNPESTAECDTDSAGPFNFLDAKIFPRGAKELKRQDKRLAEVIEEARMTYKVEKKKLVPTYDEKELKELEENFNRRMVSSQEDEDNKYLAHTELMSDHIPVAMRCSGSEKDDD